jgi:serine/threonine protein kinase
LKEEAALHIRLRHPNIVLLYGICIDPVYQLVLELMPCSLTDYLAQLSATKLSDESSLPWPKFLQLQEVASLVYEQSVLKALFI